MKTASRIVMVATLGCICACGPSIQAVKVPGVDLGHYRTYAFHQPPATDTSAVALDHSPAGQAIKSELTRALFEKGISPAKNGPPDFLVAYHVVLRDKFEVTDWGYSGGWGWYGWAGAPVTITEYTEGTIIVDFVDPASRNVFWRGTATRIEDHPLNPSLRKVSASVDKMMQRYPTQMATAGSPARM